MSIVLDYTARIDPVALKEAGATGVCRYISLPRTDTAWKRIGLTEYRELVAAGIAVTLNFEYAADDWLGGAAAGKSHGTVAAGQARMLGYPSGSVIPGSADFDMTRTQWESSGRAYAKAFAAEVRAGGYRPGVYGAWDVLTWVRAEGIMDAFWQSMSHGFSQWRNAKPWPGAHLRQHPDKKWVGGRETDWNDILIPDWGGTDMLLDPSQWQPIANTHDRLFELYSKTIPAMQAAQVSENATLATLLHLLQAATTGGGNLDTAIVTAAIAAEHETTRQLLVDQHAVEMAVLKADHDAELAGLRAELAASGG